METSFFYDLYKIITSPALFKISETEFLLFLLGDFRDKDLYDYEDIEQFLLEHKSEATIPLSSLPKHKYSKSKQLCSDLALEDLIQIQFDKSTKEFISIKKTILKYKSEILSLYERYSIPIKSDDIDIEKSLNSLFRLCVTGLNPLLFASYKNQKLKPETLNSTLGRDEHALVLQKKLHQYHKIIISGQYGTGKTHFIKYCLNKWALKDYCYISYGTDLKSTLGQILYRNIYGYKYNDNSGYGLYNEKYSSSLLIIDNMYFSPDFSGELEYLSKMAVNMIVITVRDVPEQIFHGFYLYGLPPLPDDALYEIFANDSGISLGEKELKIQLSDATLNNILLVSLIAFQCRKLSTLASKTDRDTDIVKLVLSNLGSLTTHMDIDFSDNYKFKHRYSRKTLDLIGHVKSVYNLFKKSKVMEDKTKKLACETLKRLCLFGWAQLPRKFVENVLPSCNETSLYMLSEMGLITLSDKFIQLSPLISHAVFAAEKFSSVDYELISQRLLKFLQEYEQTLDTPYLSDSLLILFKSLYNEIPEQNNSGQQKTSQQFEQWQELSYLIADYYRQNSAPELAREVTELIRYPDSLKNRHNALDKLLIELCNKMLSESEFDQMPNHIATYVTMLDNLPPAYNSPDEKEKLTNLYQSASINLTALILNALDTALNFLCRFFLDEDNSDYERPKRYLSVLRSFLFSSYATQLSHKQLLFYRSCYCLIITSLLPPSPLSPEGFQQYIYTISPIVNKKYSLYGLAFVIFWQSFYSYQTADKDIFISSVIPRIIQLNETVGTCEVIPFHAFHLCLSAYIEASKVQYVFISHGILDKKSCDFFTPNILRNLFSRCNLTKKDLDELIAKTNFIFNQ